MNDQKGHARSSSHISEGWLFRCEQWIRKLFIPTFISNVWVPEKLLIKKTFTFPVTYQCCQSMSFMLKSQNSNIPVRNLGSKAHLRLLTKIVMLMLRSIAKGVNLKKKQHKKNTLRVFFVLFLRPASPSGIYGILLLPLMLLTTTVKKKHYSRIFTEQRNTFTRAQSTIYSCKVQILIFAYNTC